MDNSLYFVRCMGKEKGPYAFYQIQQMRTEEVFTREKFYDEEWVQIEQFLDDGGDIPHPKTGPAAIRLKEEPKKKATGRVLIGLTYISYSMAGFTVLAAMLLAEQDYVIQSRVMFWLGLVFSVALCHTFVDRSCRRQLQRYARSTQLDLVIKYVMALILFAGVIAAAVFFEKVVNATSLNYQTVLGTGKIYFVTAALIALYKPFYISFLREHDYLKPVGKTSIPWLTALVGFVILLGLYVAPTAGLSHPAIDVARESIFVSETRTRDESDWKFSVHLRDTEKAVQRILGKPKIVGRDFIYGPLRVSFDQKHLVARLRFDGRDLATSVFSRKSVLTGLTPVDNFTKMKSVLGAKNVTFGDDVSETHVWELAEYRVAACFWLKDNPAGRADSVKWLEISATN